MLIVNEYINTLHSHCVLTKHDNAEHYTKGFLNVYIVLIKFKILGNKVLQIIL